MGLYSQLTRRIGFGLSVAAVSLSTVHAQPSAQSGLMRLIVPYAAGGPSDGTGRVIQPVLAEALHRTAIVENIAGAGGALGARSILKAPPHNELHALVASPNELILAPLTNPAITYKPEEFTLAGVFGAIPYALVGRSSLAPNDIDELIALLREAEDRPLSYGSMGHGSLNHLAAEDFKARTGAHMFHAPYSGGAPLLQDLAGGQIDIAFATFTSDVMQLVDSGRLKFYGLTLQERAEAFKALPTVNEGNFLKDFDYSIFVGLAVRKGTSPETVQQLNDAIAAASQDPQVRKRLQNYGYLTSPHMSPQETSKFYASETKKYQDLSASIAPE